MNGSLRVELSRQGRAHQVARIVDNPEDAEAAVQGAEGHLEHVGVQGRVGALQENAVDEVLQLEECLHRAGTFGCV